MTQSEHQSAESVLHYARPRLTIARGFGRLLLDPLPRGILVLIWLSAGLAAVYCISIVYAAAIGYALPTAAIFRMPYSTLIERLEASLPRALLIVAFAGILIGWLAKAGLIDEAQVRRNEVSGVRLLRRYGLLIISSFSAGPHLQ